MEIIMTKHARSAIAIVLCTAVATAGCAATGARGVAVAPGTDRQSTNPDVLAEYVQRLPAGSAIRIHRVSGGTLRGTLMKATEQMMVVQPRTRVPEPPVEIAYKDVVSVTPEQQGNNIGKVIGIGIAVGAGAWLGVMLILAALYGD
jgi:hypothetical protein